MVRCTYWCSVCKSNCRLCSVSLTELVQHTLSRDCSSLTWRGCVSINDPCASTGGPLLQKLKVRMEYNQVVNTLVLCFM